MQVILHSALEAVLYHCYAIVTTAYDTVDASHPCPFGHPRDPLFMPDPPAWPATPAWESAQEADEVVRLRAQKEALEKLARVLQQEARSAKAHALASAGTDTASESRKGPASTGLPAVEAPPEGGVRCVASDLGPEYLAGPIPPAPRDPSAGSSDTCEEAGAQDLCDTPTAPEQSPTTCAAVPAADTFPSLPQRDVPVPTSGSLQPTESAAGREDGSSDDSTTEPVGLIKNSEQSWQSTDGSADGPSMDSSSGDSAGMFASPSEVRLGTLGTHAAASNCQPLRQIQVPQARCPPGATPAPSPNKPSAARPRAPSPHPDALSLAPTKSFPQSEPFPGAVAGGPPEAGVTCPGAGGRDRGEAEGPGTHGTLSEGEGMRLEAISQELLHELQMPREGTPPDGTMHGDPAAPTPASGPEGRAVDAQRLSVPSSPPDKKQGPSVAEAEGMETRERTAQKRNAQDSPPALRELAGPEITSCLEAISAELLRHLQKPYLSPPGPSTPVADLMEISPKGGRRGACPAASQSRKDAGSEGDPAVQDRVSQRTVGALADAFGDALMMKVGLPRYDLLRRIP